MRRGRLAVTVAVVLAIESALVPSFVAAQSVIEPIAWQNSLAEARVASAESGRPVLVYVTGGVWCDPCVWLETTVLRETAIAELVSHSYIPVRLSDTGLEWRALGIDRLPTLLVLDPVGNERLRLDGVLTARALENELRLVAQRIAATVPPTAPPEETRGLFDRARFRIGSGTLWNAGGGRWYSEDAGIPPQLEEFDRDEEFLYLIDATSGIVLAISIADEGRSLWRWDRRQESWVEEAAMTRLPDAER